MESNIFNRYWRVLSEFSGIHSRPSRTDFEAFAEFFEHNGMDCRSGGCGTVIRKMFKENSHASRCGK